MQGAKYEEEEDDVQVKVIFKYDYSFNVSVF
jgi:hypothetical protein